MYNTNKKWYPFLIFLVVAIYFIVKAFNIIIIPQVVLDQEKWIGLAAAILLLWGGYKSIQNKPF